MKPGKQLRTRAWITALAILILAGATVRGHQPHLALAGNGPQDVQKKPLSDAPKKVHIDLNQAVGVALPQVKQNLKAIPFKTPDGKEGWVVGIPGGHPIATPAYADAMIFVGGGYGSHEFYAFDARTGVLAWRIQASDDGPTAAVVEDGYVAFNTESCTLIVVDEKTGKVVWQEWLGDPLMSQPAIYKGRLFIAYPAGQRGQQHSTPNAPKARPGTYRLLSMDLRTGRHIWEQEITADVISAPVVSDDKVYFICFDGTSFALNVSDGSIVWKKKNAGTSAPVVANGEVVLTQKEQKAGKTYEGLRRVDARQGKEKDARLLAREEAEYLAEGRGGGVGLSASMLKALDSSVGFSSPPAPAKLADANKNVGVSTVVGAWAYQGSRAVFRRGRILNAQGHYLNSINASSGQFAWRAEVTGANLPENAQIFSPPALGREYMYLSSSAGFLASVRQQNGELGFLYSLKHPMVFQPALARGNVYVGTADGLLICLKTGNLDAEGWYGWGGNAQHNE